jgi:hypothetical protein
MRFSDVITLLEANLYNKNDLIDLIDSVLRWKNVTKPEIINWFKKQYVNWVISPVNDDAPETDFRHYKKVKYYTPKLDDPEWARKSDIVKFDGFSSQHGNYLAHVIDYFEQLDNTELKKIYKQPYEIIIKKVEEWDEFLASQMGKVQEKLEEGKDIQTLMTFPNGYRFVKLLSKKAYDEEGKQMGHCAAGYAEIKTSVLYSLKDEKGESHVTIEERIGNNENDEEDEDEYSAENAVVVQIKGKENKAPVKKYWPYVKEFILKNDLLVIRDGQNVGMVDYEDKYYFPDSEEFLELYKKVIVPKREELIKTIFEEAKDNYGVVKSIPLNNQFLTELPDFSNITVLDNFYCEENQLTSLKGAPKKVGGSFYCNHNQLTSLQGAPKKVGKDFYCHHNQLTSLQGAPEEVGGAFLCNRNQLTSLEGGPKKVGSEYICSVNLLTTLHGAPEIIKDTFSCSNNQLTNLIGAPKVVGSFFNIGYNKLTSLQGMPSKIGFGSSVDIVIVDGNPVKFTKEDIKKAIETSKKASEETFKEYFDRRGTII